MPVITLLEQNQFTTVTITTTTSGAKLYYTLDGTTPGLPKQGDVSVKVYSNGVVVRETGVVVKAVAYKTGLNIPQPFSDMAEATVAVIERIESPAFDPPTVEQFAGVRILLTTLMDDSDTVDIFYTLCAGTTCPTPLDAHLGVVNATTGPMTLLYTQAGIALAQQGPWTLSAVSVAKESNDTRLPSVVATRTYMITARCQPPTMPVRPARYVQSVLVTAAAESADLCSVMYRVSKVGTLDASPFAPYNPSLGVKLIGVGNYSFSAYAKREGWASSVFVSALYIIVPKPIVLASRLRVDAGDGVHLKATSFQYAVASALAIPAHRVIVRSTEKDLAPGATDTFVIKSEFAVGETPYLTERSSEALSQHLLATPPSALHTMGITAVWKEGDVAPPHLPPAQSASDDDATTTVVIVVLALVLLGTLFAGVWWCRRKEKKPTIVASSFLSDDFAPADKLLEEELQRYEVDTQQAQSVKAPSVDNYNPNPSHTHGAATRTEVRVVEERAPPLPPRTVYAQQAATPYNYTPYSYPTLPSPAPSAPRSHYAAPTPFTASQQPAAGHWPQRSASQSGTLFQQI